MWPKVFKNFLFPGLEGCKKFFKVNNYAQHFEKTLGINNLMENFYVAPLWEFLWVIL